MINYICYLPSVFLSLLFFLLYLQSFSVFLFIGSKLCLLDVFLVIISLNFTIWIFPLLNSLQAFTYVVRSIGPWCNVIKLCFVHFVWKWIMNLFVRISFTLWTYIFYLFISGDRKHFLGFCDLLFIPVTSFNVATFSAWPGLLKPIFRMCYRVLIPPIKVVTGNDLYNFFVHSKTKYRSDCSCRKTAGTLIAIYFLSKCFVKHFTFVISTGFYWNVLAIVDII